MDYHIHANCEENKLILLATILENCGQTRCGGEWVGGGTSPLELVSLNVHWIIFMKEIPISAISSSLLATKKGKNKTWLMSSFSEVYKSIIDLKTGLNINSGVIVV